MAISRVVSEILSVEKWRDLEIRVRAILTFPRILKAVPFDKLCIVSY